jgi:hypothetical protein
MVFVPNTIPLSRPCSTSKLIFEDIDNRAIWPLIAIVGVGQRTQCPAHLPFSSSIFASV